MKDLKELNLMNFGTKWMHILMNSRIFAPDHQVSIHYMDVILLEVDLPSKKNNLVCQEPAPDGMLVAARVRDFALCTSCTKLRCIFGKYVLGESDSEQPWKRLHIHVEDNLINPSQEVLSRFRRVYPLCEVCQENGKTVLQKKVNYILFIRDFNKYILNIFM
ncbi:hypothetical protein RhiirA1_444771 [Rhizophagus irregularis]|uniref:Uncharacterized protein n=1 Tax=Rhizophagus irregularis TaxID=588596 RepID=A0A2N0RBP6_9GLOM|nr:hypothetical protein RhiirA1_444771 [Rhizophagus irregularis]